MTSVAELRQILKEDNSGKNLYGHLTETLMKLLLDRPANAYDNFELISADIKANPLNPDPEKGRAVPPSADEIAKQSNWTKKCAGLLTVPAEPAESQGVKFPDLMDEAYLFEWAGISLGKGDIYRLYLAIKKLSETLVGDVERLRFFGRISTRTNPYYIVEGISPEEEEGIVETNQEGKAGANKYSYWVTQSVESGVWVKLPNVTMEQVVSARQFKRFLTGNLEANVPSYPPFAGKEKNFLRAQIARISGETLISPDGYFELDESEPPVAKLVEAEALAAFSKTSSELKDPEAWKHHEVELNKIGRVTAMPEQLGEDGEPIEPEEPIEVTPPLNAIVPEAWTFRMCPGGSGVADGSAVVVRSLKWPGAVAIAAGKRFVNIYFGNGIEYVANTYTPPLPRPIQTEWKASEDDMQLVEAVDQRVDPTPPKEEGEEEE